MLLRCRRRALIAAALLVATSALAGVQGQQGSPSLVWKPAGPWGGQAMLLVADPHRPDRVWGVSPLRGFLHRTDDGGRHWRWLGRGVGQGSIAVLAVSPFTPDLLLAGTEAFGVWRSRDGGLTWEPARRGLPWGQTSVATRAVLFDPLYQGVAWALLATGEVYITTDDGENWRRHWLFFPSQGPGSSLVTLTPSGELLAYSHGDLQRCSPWTGVCQRLLEGLRGLPTALASLPTPGGDWLALGTEVFTSAGGGLSWEPANEGLALSPHGRPVVKGFRLDPRTRRVLAWTSGGLFQWDPAARRWELLDPRLRAEAASERGCGWTAAAEGHLFGCGPLAAPLAWLGPERELEERNEGFLGQVATAVLLDPQDGSLALAATETGLHRRLPGAERWAQVLSWPRGRSRLAAAGPGGPWYLANFQGLFRSRDRGWTWTQLPTPFSFDQLQPAPQLALPGGENLVAVAGGGRLWHSQNGGGTWTRLPHVVDAVAVSPANPSQVWAAGLATVLVSDDGGRSWRTMGQGRGEMEAWVQCPAPPCAWETPTVLAVDPSPGGHLLAGTHGMGVRAFTPGRGWGPTALPVPQAYAMLSLPSAPGLILVAGVEASSDGRQLGKVGVAERRGERWAWTPLGEGGELPDVYGLDASPRHGRYAAAGAGGVFLLERAPEENRPLRRGAPPRR